MLATKPVLDKLDKMQNGNPYTISGDPVAKTDSKKWWTERPIEMFGVRGVEYTWPRDRGLVFRKSITTNATVNNRMHFRDGEKRSFDTIVEGEHVELVWCDPYNNRVPYIALDHLVLDAINTYESDNSSLKIPRSQLHLVIIQLQGAGKISICVSDGKLEPVTDFFER